MTDSSFRIFLVTFAPYTSGRTTIRVKANATPAELTRAIMKAVCHNEKEFSNYLLYKEKEKIRKEAMQNEVLNFRSEAYMAGVIAGMQED